VKGLTYISKSYKNSFTLSRFNQQGNQTAGEVIVLAVNFGSRLIILQDDKNIHLIIFYIFLKLFSRKESKTFCLWKQSLDGCFVF
jgi:hypothetical protein